MIGVRIHHPTHNLLVRPHVGRRHISVRSDKIDEFLHVAAGEMFELRFRQLLWIDNDAALGAAIRQADERALPTHPHRERGDFANGDVLMKTNTALRRTGGKIMLDAIPFEDSDAAITPADGQRDCETAAWILGAIAN